MLQKVLLNRCLQVSPNKTGQKRGESAMKSTLSPPQNHGDRGTRTPDLCVANASLSQLSYIPKPKYIIAHFPKKGQVLFTILPQFFSKPAVAPPQSIFRKGFPAAASMPVKPNDTHAGAANAHHIVPCKPY